MIYIIMAHLLPGPDLLSLHKTNLRLGYYPVFYIMETFEIPVIYQGKELQFNARLIRSGYVHKIEVDVNGHGVILENDDEGNYRAMIADSGSENKIDKDLVKAIVGSLELILK